jgi:hypothetical protein
MVSLILSIVAMLAATGSATAIGSSSMCTPSLNAQPTGVQAPPSFSTIGAYYLYMNQGTTLANPFAFRSSGWVGNPTYAITPSLPAGLSMDPITGDITGTPSVVSAESDYQIKVEGRYDSSTPDLYCLVADIRIAVQGSGGGGGGGSNNQPTRIPFTFASSTFTSLSDVANLASGTSFPAFTVSFSGISQGGQYDTLNTVLGDMQNNNFYPVTGAVSNNNSSYVSWNPAGNNCGVTRIALGGVNQVAGSGITCTPMAYIYNGVTQYRLSIKFPTVQTANVSFDVAGGTYTTSGSGSSHGYFANAFFNDNTNAYQSGASQTFATAPVNNGGGGSNTNSGSSAPAVSMSFPVSPGQRIVGEDVDISATDLAINTDYSIVLRSTPQVLEEGRTVSSTFNTSVTIPDNLEAGWHSITFSATRTDGSAMSEVVYFKIAADGTLLATSTDAPAELALTGAITAGAIPLSIIVLLMGFAAFFIAREINPDFMRVMTLTRNANGELDFVKRRIRSEEY